MQSSKWVKSYIRVKHVAGKENARNVDCIVATTSNTSCQGSKTNSRCFTDDDPRSRRRSQGEENGDNETKGGLCERSRFGNSLSWRANGACNTQGNEEADVDERSPYVDGTTTEIRGQNPRQHDKDHLESGCDQTEGKRSVGAHASLCEGISIIAQNSRDRDNQNLRSKKYTAWLAMRLPVRFCAA